MASKKEAAFKLFDKGKTPMSPEVKALKLKGNTRYSYYLDWKKLRGIEDETESASAKTKEKVIDELKMLTPKEEDEGEEEENADEELTEPKEAEHKGKTEAKRSGDGKRPPTMIAGQGLTFSITISTKTLMLYQIAAADQNEELTLGDFIDACVEDTYLGRGLDLGLVETGGKNG